MAGTTYKQYSYSKIKYNFLTDPPLSAHCNNQTASINLENVKCPMYAVSIEHGDCATHKHNRLIKSISILKEQAEWNHR